MAKRWRTIELRPDAYDLVAREAERRGVAPEEVVDEMVRAELRKPEQRDLDAVLRGAAALRAQLPPIDGVELARQSRADLEARGA